MKEITLKVNGQIALFQIVFACKDYIFFECIEKPALRWFFTIGFLNKQK